MNPSQPFTQPNYLAISLTGTLVGCISAIVFGKTFSQRDPQEVFFYTLGIPALLVATVSNVTTKADATQTITATRVAASAAILTAAPPALDVGSLQEVRPPASPQQGLLRPSGLAWGAEQSPEGAILLVQAAGHDWIVSVGSYPTEAAAWKRVTELGAQRLRVETYLAKNLRVFKGGGGFYYVSYSGLTTRDEATRIYNLLRVNDPELSPQIIQAGH